MDDLVKRLRGYGSNRLWPHGPACDCTQAADRIEALEAQVRAADALAEAHLAIVETTEGLPGTTIQECRQISRKALAAYRATKEGGE